MRLVSIITPCFNSASYVEKLLDSILDQDYPNIQLICVDDGSTDSTLAILDGYKERFDDKGYEFTIVTKKNGGVASAVNAGLKKVKGEYITFIDSDDYIDSTSIRRRAEFLDGNLEYQGVRSKVNIVNIDNYSKVIGTKGDLVRPWRESLFMDMLTDTNYTWTPVAYMLRFSFFNEIHKTGLIPDYAVGQNIQLFLPIWYRAKIGYINIPLATVVERGDSHSRAQEGKRSLRDRHEAILKAFIDTLDKIEMDDAEREGYINLVRSKYERPVRIFRDVFDGRDDLARLYSRDEERFRSSYFTSADTAGESQLAARLVFSAHSLEKSLSNDGFEIGHGFMVVKLLIGFLDVYKAKSYSTGHKSYINTLSVLKSFFDKHKDTKYENEIRSIFGDWIHDIESSDADIGGADIMQVSSKRDNSAKNFKDLAEGRFAVRSYSDKSVNKGDIEEAIKIATKTPTVCNRQPVRVRAMYDKNIIKKVLEIQGGIAHYDTPPVLLLVTADDSNYVGVNERNQGFIDGGLFAMSVLYALEYMGLAACPLHAMFEAERDLNIRGMLDIPDNEKLITFISAGHFNEDNSVCKSFRYPTDYIMKEVSELSEYRVESIDITSTPEDNDKSLTDSIRVKLKIRTRLRSLAARLNGFISNGTHAQSISRMMDVLKYGRADGAILTLTGYFNYGNILQRYALQKVLKDNNYNFVSYVDKLSAPRDMYAVGVRRTLKKPLRFIKRVVRGQRPYWYNPRYSELYPEAKKLENIIEFVNNNIWIKPFDPRDKYRTYITGSDQVWRDWWSNKNSLGYYFFNFLEGRDVKRISYAASFGNDDIGKVMDEESVDYVGSFIDKIDYVSIREKSGVKLAKDTWGIDNAQLVLDPTLLVDSRDYSKIINDSESRDLHINPMFTYILGSNPSIEDFITQFEEVAGVESTNIRAHANSDDTVLPPVEYWLKGFRDSDLVITNSFHGMMFSVINNTDFIIIGRKAGGISRISDFLEEFGISGRYVDESELGDFNLDHLEPINWIEVNNILKDKKELSKQWLLNSVASR